MPQTHGRSCRFVHMPINAERLLRFLFAFAWCSAYPVGYAATGETNLTAKVLVTLGEPEWFTNIRGERWVQTRVALTNTTDRSFWTSASPTRQLLYQYDRRKSKDDRWERFSNFGCGFGWYTCEIRPHSSFAFIKVFTDPVGGMHVRLVLPMSRRDDSHDPPILTDREEFISNPIIIPADPSPLRFDDVSLPYFMENRNLMPSWFRPTGPKLELGPQGDSTQRPTPTPDPGSQRE
jgi:hypothetical protein